MTQAYVDAATIRKHSPTKTNYEFIAPMTSQMVTTSQPITSQQPIHYMQTGVRGVGTPVDNPEKTFMSALINSTNNEETQDRTGSSSTDSGNGESPRNSNIMENETPQVCYRCSHWFNNINTLF